ncbi:MAG: phospho-N-acetylmuramoyl-pentapeptide-transferase [Clostridia bacterium]|nr:phospho-N-acetylmuramoyl-pentapeptide-transferase [Clostridia bacterium]
MIAITSIIAAMTAFLVTAVSGRIVIPYLRKLKFGQTILDIGPRWHKSKQGTPTMGGVMFIIGIVLGITVAMTTYALGWREIYSGETSLSKVRLFAGISLCILSGVIGFIDDYLKVVKKQNIGLTAPQKFGMQILVALGFAVTLYMAGDTKLFLPFIGTFDLGVWYIPIVVLFVAGFNNAVNLTDGLDGLASTVTTIVALLFMVLSGVVCNNATMSLFSSAVAGGCLGFLIWNFYPAKVFMGDTGSLFLGGAVCAMAFGIGQPVLLIFAGFVYLMETASVMLQVGYFKLTHGKRLFKMAPIHHHFEMCGKNEIAINRLFGIITVIGCGIAFVLSYFG